MTAEVIKKVLQEDGGEWEKISIPYVDLYLAGHQPTNTIELAVFATIEQKILEKENKNR